MRQKYQVNGGKEAFLCSGENTMKDNKMLAKKKEILKA